MADATDFRTSDKTTNSLFKGAGFNKSEPEAKPVSRQRQGNGGVDFNSLDDNMKAAFHHIVSDHAGFIPNITDPGQWAKQTAANTGLNAKSLMQAAKQYNKDFNANEDVFKYPWWSAARDWNPEAVGQMGQKISNGLRPSPDLISGVQSGPRMW